MNKLERDSWRNHVTLIKTALLFLLVILPISYLSIILFVLPRIERKLAYDSGGPYIKKCNLLNNQELSYEAIASLNGYIFRTSETGGRGPDAFTKTYYEDILRGYRGEKTTSDIISDDRKIIGILRDHLVKGPTWVCEITVDPATHVMKTTATFYSWGN